MRKLAALVFLLLFCGPCGIAQTEPPFEPEPKLAAPNNELFGGYDYEHADLGASSTGLQGFAIEFSHYVPQLFHGHAGVTLEISRASNNAVDPTGTEYSSLRFVGGPTVRLRRYGFFTPSIHALAGVDRATITVPSGTIKFFLRDTDLAVVGGGSLDGTLSRHLAVRLAQFDYVYTRHFNATQSSFRYLGGIVLLF